MIRPSFSIAALTLLATFASQAEAKFDLSRFSKPITGEELSHGEAGFSCLKELFGEEGEHVLTQTPVGYSKDAEMTDEERYEAIYKVFGADGIDNVCGITRKLRKARLLTSNDSTNRKPEPAPQQRRAQACVTSNPLYPAQNDVDGAYNNWAAANVDKYLPPGQDRTSRTDPTRLVADIQDSIDVVLEAEYSSMTCRPIFDGIEAIVSIPDAIVLNQGGIVGGIKNFVCGFGSQVASHATNDLYKKLDRARYHDSIIDGVETRAAYDNMGSMVNQVCGSSARLDIAMRDLDAIKRKLGQR